jgi:hypothetical protein
MKKIHRNGEVRTYYTMTEVAATLHIELSAFWRRVYDSAVYPKPTVRLQGGRRLYYTAEVAEALIASVRAEAAQGEVAQ